jgi:hypothetical protein
VPAVLHALVTFAATEGEEGSKVAYYALGGILSVFAVVVSAIGIRREETFPPTTGAARAVMGLALLLVLGTMASAVLTS